MIADLVTQTTGLLQRRFVLNAFVPTVAAVGLLTALVAAMSTTGLGDALSWLERLSGLRQTLLGVLALAVAAVLAGLLAAGTPTLVRWHEGYWDSSAGRWLGRLGADWHRRQLGALAADPRADGRVAAEYPLPSRPEEVMPTRIGNILKNAELYPEVRYGIDAVTVWPRLYPLLPADVSAALSAVKADLELQLVTSTLAAVLGVAGGVVVVAAGGPWPVFLAWYWGGALIWWLAVRGAAGPARAYGQQVKVAFDLYRRDLLTQLAPDAAAAPGPPEERARWQALARFWHRGVPLDADVSTADADALTLPPASRLARLPLAGWWLLVVAVTGLAVLPLLS